MILEEDFAHAEIENFMEIVPTSNTLLGCAAALGAAIFSSMTQVSMRYVSVQGSISPIVIAFWTGPFGILLAITLSLSR